MARKSRKNVESAVIEEVSAPVQYNAAAYVRLSVDDTKKRGDSLETQRNIIENYVATTPDIKIAEVYSDNNTTGTNFDRPGFQRMLADAHSGKINCIIVKDLSRFGRNAIDGGFYIEKLLPSLGVRFIAITDSFDSNEPDSGIMLPIRQIINESYALDIGRKRRAVQEQQIAAGIHVGRLAPYGYMKAPGDCHRLVINEETAPVIRKIFAWANDGISGCEIVRRLNDEGIPSPAHYNYSKGYDKRPHGIAYWKPSTITGILRSEFYIGNMVQSRKRKRNGKLGLVPKSEWVCVPNTHEPIISRELFENVQRLRQPGYEYKLSLQPAEHTPNILKGKVFCAHCGYTMKRKYQRKYKKKEGTYWFRCETQQKYGRDACGIVSVRESDILTEVSDTLHRQSDEILGNYVKLEKESAAVYDPAGAYESELRSINREIGNASRYNKSLYESLVDGLITPEEHAQMKADYEQKINSLSERADEIRRNRSCLEAEKSQLSGITDAVSLATSNKTLTAEIVDAVIDKVSVWKGMKFEVSYRFETSRSRDGMKEAV